jgi:hypothetical protein
VTPNSRRSLPLEGGLGVSWLRDTDVSSNLPSCTLPPKAGLIGRDELRVPCERRWHLEHYWSEGGEILGPAWILL